MEYLILPFIFFPAGTRLLKESTPTGTKQEERQLFFCSHKKHFRAHLAGAACLPGLRLGIPSPPPGLSTMSLSTLRKQYPSFCSHSWDEKDEQGRNNHVRVVQIAKALKTRGLPVWIDEDEMTGMGGV